MKKILLTGIVSALFCVFLSVPVMAQSAAEAPVQEMEAAKVKHDFVVSVSSFSNFRKAVVDVAGKIQPGFDMLVGTALGNTSPYLPKGIATSGPIGLVGNAGSDESEPLIGILGFIPVSASADEEDFSEKLEDAFPDAIVKIDGKTAFITTDAKTKTVADPASLLGGLDKKYLLAAQIAPKKFADAAKAAAEDAPEPEAVEKFAKVLEMIDTILLGVNVDKKGTIIIDSLMQPTAKSEMAKALAKTTEAKSKLAGFYDPKAAVSFQGVYYVSPEIAETVKAAWEDSPMPDSLKDIIANTLEAGKIDFGGSVSINKNGQPAVFWAVSVVDGPAVKAFLEELAEEDHLNVEFDGNTVLMTNEYDEDNQAAIIITKAYVFGAFGAGDLLEPLKKKVAATLKADAPETTYQAHVDASLFKLVNPGAELSGKLTVKGYVTGKSVMSRTEITSDFLAGGFQAGMMIFQMMSGGFGGGDFDFEYDGDDDQY